MALKINFNYEAAATHTALKSNERLMNQSLLRLSTGLRILSAQDDAAGLFISDQLSLVASGLDQGNRNIQTGISALRIAENSAGQIFTKLQEIYVRAESAANDINDPNARKALQQEINNFIDAIQKIGTDTEYNGIRLLDGTFVNKYIHYGPRMDQVVTVNISDIRATNLGGFIISAPGAVTSSATSAYSAIITGNWQYDPTSDIVTVAGANLKPSLPSTTGAVDAKAIADAINSNKQLQDLGVSAKASNKSIAALWNDINVTAQVDIKFFVGSNTNAAFTITYTSGTITLTDLVNKINTQAANNKLSLKASIQNNSLVLETNGETIGIEITSATGGPSINLAQFLQGASGTITPSSTASATGSAVKVGKLYVLGMNPYSYDFTGISASNEGLGISATGSGEKNTLYTIDVTTNEGAEKALLIVDLAMKKVDTVRSQIGAIMNNLQSIYDAQKTAQDNTKEAENTIRNVDYAEEMTRFTTYQIRMQSGIAMLAQANQLPQLVLQLLR